VNIFFIAFPTNGIRANVSIKGGREVMLHSYLKERIVINLICVFFLLNSVMAAFKLDVPLFDGRMNFSLRQCTIKDYLVQKGLDCALEKEKPSEIEDLEWNTIQKKSVNTISWCLLYKLK
jgi:hypothetical protein